MPFYQFECKCGIIEEIFLKMKDSDIKQQCPKCNQRMRKIILVPNITIDSKQPKTIGDLADKNTERMVKEGKLDKENLDYQTNKEEKRKRKQKREKITNMSERQQLNYIFTGKK